MRKLPPPSEENCDLNQLTFAHPPNMYIIVYLYSDNISIHSVSRRERVRQGVFDPSFPGAGKNRVYRDFYIYNMQGAAVCILGVLYSSCFKWWAGAVALEACTAAPAPYRSEAATAGDREYGLMLRPTTSIAYTTHVAGLLEALEGPIT